MNSGFRNLNVWKKATELVLKVYQVTKNFPKEEVYGLTSQIRRCAVSIPSNIAEGSERSTHKDFANFARIAKGSIAELETQLLIALNLGYIDKKACENLLREIIAIRKMLSGLISKLKQ